MIEVTGEIKGVSIDFETNKVRVILEVNEKNDFLSEYDKLKEKKLFILLKKHFKKRSLDANAYAWKLISEIGDCLRMSKEDVYLEMLKRYGQSEIISVLAHIPLEGFVKYYEEAGESELNGKAFKHYKIYKGSSEYDTREMSILIDGIVAEAKDLGIQTDTPEQIAEMMRRYEETHGKYFTK